MGAFDQGAEMAVSVQESGWTNYLSASCYSGCTAWSTGAEKTDWRNPSKGSRRASLSSSSSSSSLSASSSDFDAGEPRPSSSSSSSISSDLKDQSTTSDASSRPPLHHLRGKKRAPHYHRGSLDDFAVEKRTHYLDAICDHDAPEEKGNAVNAPIKLPLHCCACVTGPQKLPVSPCDLEDTASSALHHHTHPQHYSVDDAAVSERFKALQELIPCFKELNREPSEEETLKVVVQYVKALECKVETLRSILASSTD